MGTNALERAGGGRAHTYRYAGVPGPCAAGGSGTAEAPSRPASFRSSGVSEKNAAFCASSQRLGLRGVGRQLSADEGQEARRDTYRHEHMLVVAKVVEEHSVEYRSSSPGGVRARGGGGRAGGAAGLTGDDQKVGYS